jgi:arylsulfatase A-like enzyme
MKRYYQLCSLLNTSGAALCAQQPNVIFVMLDDFGYSQRETYAAGLTVEDLDPALIELRRQARAIRTRASL